MRAKLNSRCCAGVVAPIMAVVLCGCAHHEPRFSSVFSEYQTPLVSPGAHFSSLPPAVQNTVRAETGSAAIADIQKRNGRRGVEYLIRFENEGLYPPLYVAADGSVLNPDHTVAIGAAQDLSGVVTGAASGLTLSDLPGPVLNTLNDHAPWADVDQIHKEVWGERNVYIVSFKDAKHYPRIYIQSDGTVLKSGPQ